MNKKKMAKESAISLDRHRMAKEVLLALCAQADERESALRAENAMRAVERDHLSDKCMRLESELATLRARVNELEAHILNLEAKARKVKP
jgi:cell division protein FtsB